MPQLILFVLLVGMALSIAAPIAMFAAKAGFIRVPAQLQDGAWNSGRAWRWAAWWAVGLTALGAFGAIVLAGSWWDSKTYERNPDGRPVGTASTPRIQDAYRRKYGVPACTQWNLYASTPCVQIAQSGRPVPSDCKMETDACHFGTGWNVVWTDGLPFFLATTLLLYARAAAAHERRRELSLFLIPPFVGAVAFLVSMNVWDWLEFVSRHGVPALIPRIIDAAIHEVITAPVAFLQALASASPIEAVKAWLDDEVTRLNGSFYKLGSLYPKMLVVMILGGIVQYMASSD